MLPLFSSSAIIPRQADLINTTCTRILSVLFIGLAHHSRTSSMHLLSCFPTRAWCGRHLGLYSHLNIFSTRPGRLSALMSVYFDFDMSVHFDLGVYVTQPRKLIWLTTFLPLFFVPDGSACCFTPSDVHIPRPGAVISHVLVQQTFSFAFLLPLFHYVIWMDLS